VTILHYLFDWGDTLMMDQLDQVGPMCDWPTVKVVAGAQACLARLSQTAQCHIATNAQYSNQQQIRQALKRGGLDHYIKDIYCFENLGMIKTHPEYYKKIITKLGVPAAQIRLVGDSLTRDVYPALAVGIDGIWFNPQQLPVPNKVQAVESLAQLAVAT
jgi:putative hydrolase of the HAD superfamily